MTDEISSRPTDARGPRSIGPRSIGALLGTAGWVLALAGLIVAMAAAYWPRSDIFEGATLLLDTGAERAFALFSLIGVLLATIGGLVGIIASTATAARRGIAVALWALGTVALIGALALGYAAVQTFAMSRGNWAYDSATAEVMGWSPNGMWGFLIAIVAPTLLVAAWGLCRSYGIGLLGALLVPLGVLVAALVSATLTFSDARQFAFVIVWAVFLIAAVVLGVVLERLRRTRRSRATEVSPDPVPAR